VKGNLMTEDTKLFFECTFGKKSHINLAGKIIFSPLILIIVVTWIAMDFLFGKSHNNGIQTDAKEPLR